jgi:hypothetical protein
MHYRIKPGYSFRDSDDSLKTGGELIELSPDVAAQHADKVELAEPEAEVGTVQTFADPADLQP